MTQAGLDLMTELRRPFRTRGPMGRRAMGAVVVVCLGLLVVFAGLGQVLGTPPAPDSWLLAPSDNGALSPAQSVRAPLWSAMGTTGTLWLWLCALALVPLAFAMVRRAHSTGLPRFLAILLVIVAVVSALSIVLAAEQRVLFPLTRALWAAATQGETIEENFGLILLLSPVLFCTVFIDLFLIAFVGLLAAFLGVISWGICVALCFVPTRKDLFP